MMRRLAFLVPAGLSLLAGLDAALLLLGVRAPVTTDRLPDTHGFLLVLGFVGTVIALERAVALRRPAGFASPALLGLGGILLFAPVPVVLGRLSLTLGSAALVALYVPLWRRQRDDSVLVQLLGAVLATGAALLWLRDVPTASLIPWLGGFVVLTIAGERLELARVVVVDARATSRLLAAAGAIVVGTVASLLWPAAGYPLTALALLALVAWLLVHDVATRTIRATGLARFMAGCLLAGYGWLVVAAGVWLVGGPVGDGPAYDAVVHALFLGFTISMIMAHAPVILPAVLRVRLPYHPVMIAPPVLLHASLVLRLLAGDAWGSTAALQVGGVLGIVALLGFVVLAAWAVVRAGIRDRRSREGGSRTMPRATSAVAP